MPPRHWIASPAIHVAFSETREFESILRVQSGQTAVLGGLMQDEVHNIDDGVPGLSSIPLIGELFKQKRDITRKIELVIFLRPTVIVDASLDGDYARFRGLVPRDDFFLKPDARRRDLRAEPAEPPPAANAAGGDTPPADANADRSDAYLPEFP